MFNVKQVKFTFLWSGNAHIMSVASSLAFVDHDPSKSGMGKLHPYVHSTPSPTHFESCERWRPALHRHSKTTGFEPVIASQNDQHVSFLGMVFRPLSSLLRLWCTLCLTLGSRGITRLVNLCFGLGRLLEELLSAPAVEVSMDSIWFNAGTNQTVWSKLP